MNANELAEILEGDSKHTSGRFTYSSRYIADIATMLRQQQAEIEALKKQLEPDPNICNYCGFFKGCCTCPIWSNQK